MFKEKLAIIWYKFVCVWLRILCFAFFRLRIIGAENVPDEGAFIVASNHQSFLDPALCGARLKRPMHFLARESLFSNRFFAAMISSVGTMPLKQGGGDIAIIRKVIALLKQGKGVCLFPEGTRTLDGRIEAFKPGLGLLSRRGKAPIIPAVIDGAFECWPKGKKIFKSGSIWVQYGEPITVDRIKEMGDEKLAELLKERLRKMQNELRTKRGKQPYQY